MRDSETRDSRRMVRVEPEGLCRRLQDVEQDRSLVVKQGTGGEVPGGFGSLSWQLSAVDGTRARDHLSGY